MPGRNPGERTGNGASCDCGGILGTDRYDLFGIDPGHAMYHKAWTGSAFDPPGSGWDDLGGTFASPPAVASWGANRLDIFGLGPGGAMFHKAWTVSEWYPSAAGWEDLGGTFEEGSAPVAVAWGPNRLAAWAPGGRGQCR